MSDEDVHKFMSAVANMIFLADGAAETKIFEADEAQRLREDAVRFRQSAASVFFGIETLIMAAPSNQDGMSLSDFDNALEQLIISSYRIGAATWTHNANRRHLNSTGMQDARKAKALSPKQMKRDRIKSAVLPALLARGLRRHEVLAELNKALMAEGADAISQETADRWTRKQTLTATLSAKISD